MFNYLFENRNSTVTHLLKLGDCLGRSLRENIELFSIDGEKKEVAFLTESSKVITGTYTTDNDISLNNLKVQEADIFTDNKVFNKYVNQKVSTFVGNINSTNYRHAEDSFSDILSLWENRLKFENVKKRLDEKSEVFTDSQEIISTSEFQRFLEIMPQFVYFLQEEKENILHVKEIENAVKLSNAVSKAFNFPKISYETLQEDEAYTISQGINKSIYELICKQELVTKELLESKKNFEEVWATNPKIRNLAALVFDAEEEEVLETLVEAIMDVPYLALATKKQLYESLDNALGLIEYSSLSPKKIKEYASTLFEMKKPLKKIIITLLNEKYGINVSNLKETASFKSLANTQAVIFESLYQVSPKGSVVKETLGSLVKLFKNKSGVEVIDVNDLLQECFVECEYNSYCENYSIVENLSFDNILGDEYTPTELLERAKKSAKKAAKKKSPDGEEGELLLGKKKAADDDQSNNRNLAKDAATAQGHEKDPENDRGEEDDTHKLAQDPDGGHDCAEVHPDVSHEKWNESKKKSKKKTGDDEMKEEAEVAEKDAPEAEETSDEVETEFPEQGEAGEESQEMSKEDFLDTLKDFEELLKDISPEEEEEEVAEEETDEEEA